MFHDYEYKFMTQISFILTNEYEFLVKLGFSCSGKKERRKGGRERKEGGPA